MKRDMDLIRRITLAASELPPDKTLRGIDGVSDALFARHVIWMQEAGLVKAATDDSDEPFAAVFRLTWDGCEFADSVRSDTVWQKAKDNVLKPTMSFSFTVLREWLTAELRQGLPTLRGGS